MYASFQFSFFPSLDTSTTFFDRTKHVEATTSDRKATISAQNVQGE